MGVKSASRLDQIPEVQFRTNYILNFELAGGGATSDLPTVTRFASTFATYLNVITQRDRVFFFFPLLNKKAHFP